jgi:hypothetical protein
MRKNAIVMVIATMVLSGGCASARVTSAAPQAYAGPRIGAIAISPGGGVLGEAVGVELFNLGFRVLDPGQTAQIVGRVNATDIEIGEPRNVAALRAAGADAVLIVKAVNGYDGNPTSASARMIGLANGDIVAGLSWQNGSCGAEGSPCDRSRRKNAATAAVTIAQELRQRLTH